MGWNRYPFHRYVTRESTTSVLNIKRSYLNCVERVMLVRAYTALLTAHVFTEAVSAPYRRRLRVVSVQAEQALFFSGASTIELDELAQVFVAMRLPFHHWIVLKGQVSTTCIDMYHHDTHG